MGCTRDSFRFERLVKVPNCVVQRNISLTTIGCCSTGMSFGVFRIWTQAHAASKQLAIKTVTLRKILKIAASGSPSLAAATVGAAVLVTARHDFQPGFSVGCGAWAGAPATRDLATKAAWAAATAWSGGTTDPGTLDADAPKETGADGEGAAARVPPVLPVLPTPLWRALPVPVPPSAGALGAGAPATKLPDDGALFCTAAGGCGAGAAPGTREAASESRSLSAALSA